MLDYMNEVIAAANELGIDILSDYELPAEGNVWHAYGEFSRRVKNVVLRINIRNSRAVREFSVELDSGAKAKIHSYIDAIRNVIESEHVEERKKAGLYDKLGSFAKEVDKPRTKYDRAMALIVEAMDPAFKASEKVGELIDRITRLIAAAHGEEMQRLPPPKAKKQLEGPQKRIPGPPTRSSRHKDLDDDIPF